MRHIIAYLNADVAGHDLEVEFEVEDDASNEEIDKIAWDELCDKVDWYWEEMEEDDL